MRVITKEQLLAGAVGVLTLGLGACDRNPVEPARHLEIEAPTIPSASAIPVPAESSVLFEPGTTINLVEGQEVHFIEGFDGVAIMRVAVSSGTYRVDLLSRADFDATRLTGLTEELGTGKGWVSPMGYGGKPLFMTDDVNDDGRRDFGLLFTASAVKRANGGSLPAPGTLELRGIHPEEGEFRGVQDMSNVGSTAWSSADPQVIAVEQTGRGRAGRFGKASVLRQKGVRTDSAHVVVRSMENGSDVVTDPNTFRPVGIDQSGMVDVTRPLLDFIASVPDGATIQLPAGARYRVEGSLLIEDRSGLTIEGNGAVLFASTDGGHLTPPNELKHKWPRKRAHLIFHGGSDIVLRNLTIEGAHYEAGSEYVVALEGQHGIILRGVQGAELDRVRVTDVYGDFVYLGSHGGKWASDIHIHDSHFERNGRQGVAFTAAEDVLLENNFIGDVQRTALDIEPNGEQGGARRLTIRDNTFGAIGGHWFAGHGKVGTIEDITLERNTVHAKMQVSTNVFGQRRKNIRIIDNVSTRKVGSPAPLMALHLVDGVEVRGNVHMFNEGRRMTGVYVTQSCDVQVSGNNFQGAAAEFDIVPFEGCGSAD
jgi:hypothetical protein